MKIQFKNNTSLLGFKSILLVVFLISLGSCNMTDDESKTNTQKPETPVQEKSPKANHVSPEFPGGKNKMFEFVQSNLVYPEEAINNNIEGTVVIQFAIGKDGKLSNEKVIKGIGYGCDEAALNVIKSMPDWKAGELNGEKSKLELSIPVKFKLDPEKVN